MQGRSGEGMTVGLVQIGMTLDIMCIRVDDMTWAICAAEECAGYDCWQYVERI